MKCCNEYTLITSFILSVGYQEGHRAYKKLAQSKVHLWKTVGLWPKTMLVKHGSAS